MTKRTIDHVNHIAGMTGRTQTFHNILLFVLRASCRCSIDLKRGRERKRTFLFILKFCTRSPSFRSDNIDTSEGKTCKNTDERQKHCCAYERVRHNAWYLKHSKNSADDKTKVTLTIVQSQSRPAHNKSNAETMFNVSTPSTTN